MDLRKTVTHTILLSAVLVGFAAAPVYTSGGETRRFLYYLEERVVKRLLLPSESPEEIYRFPEGTAVPAASAIRAANGRLIWADPKDPGVLMTWNGKSTGRIILPLHHIARTWTGYGFLWDEEERSTGKRKPEGNEGAALNLADTWYTGYLLAPDGSRAAWNVNATLKGSKLAGGSFWQRHLIYTAALDGSGVQLVLSEDYSVGDVFADQGEHRRLRFWVTGHGKSIFYTRYLDGQLSDLERGLFACNLEAGKAKTLDNSLERVLAVSEDGRSAIWTPNDDTCCGGVNYTNNKVWVRDLASGKDSILLDEWDTFGKGTVEPGKTGGADWADFYPTDARFSPSATNVALLIEEWSSDHRGYPRPQTRVYSPGRGEVKAVIRNRAPLDWADDTSLVLAEMAWESVPAGGGGWMKTWVIKEVFLYDLARGSETRLLEPGSYPIAVGR